MAILDNLSERLDLSITLSSAFPVVVPVNKLVIIFLGAVVVGVIVVRGYVVSKAQYNYITTGL